ncbi:hypothetical protein OG323_08735 [Streptomyces cyaneofuscatus]|uniref:hypothetical protein n=1 Tax=Streptomyces cyaneofuscatus TaxID=66883 RepID=UPI00386BF6C0|nr:hypothetical protein OG323_08735 [Streptomyces cyaneofuscatus]
MAFIAKKSPEQQAQAVAEKERKRQEAEERQQAEQLERNRRAFLATPVGQARQSFEQGDLVFQCSIDVMNQQAVIVAMVGSAAIQQTTDPAASSMPYAGRDGNW